MDRQARSQVNVTNLEIPADLAYVFSKADDSAQTHTDRHVTSVKGHVEPHDMNYTLPQDIDSHAFNKYVNIYVKDKSQIRRKPITSPLLAKLQDRDAKEAIAIFKLILRFINDGNLSEQREKLIADYVVQKGISNDSLRDELLTQLCTQTWINRSDSSTSERGWLLLAHALSAFQPSTTFSKYLLKYVSDQAYNGFKFYCQHKLLHSLTVNPPLPRNYPPSLLEWRAAHRQSQMALPVTFADGEVLIGHVDSWTTGEEFVSHLLRQRQLDEGDHGWTVVLRDENNLYELMGYDYVLDLLAEMEVPRGFPYTLAPFLVTTDHSKDGPHGQQKMQDSPHNADLARLIDLTTEELRDPVPVSPRPAPEPNNFFRSYSRDNVSSRDPESVYASHDAMSQTSRLNNRSLNNSVKPALSGSSILNVRYTGGNKGKAPSVPEVNGATGSRDPSRRASSSSSVVASEVGLSMSRLNNRYTSPEVPPSGSTASSSLAPSRLNQRYAKDSPAPPPPVTNGRTPTNGVSNGLPNGEDGDGLKLSDSKMNRRYAPSPNAANGARSAGQQRPDSGKYLGDRAERMSLKSSNPTDMDQWLDQVFDPILDGTGDDLSAGTDARTVQSRLKGGGRGVPGMTTTQVTIRHPGVYNPNVIATGLGPVQLPPSNVTTIPTFTGPATGSIPLGSIQVIQDPSHSIAQQLALQQQQQAQALLTQQQAQHAQLAAHALQQENHDLQQQLVQKDLEKQLLEKTLEYERLNTQIKENKSPAARATQSPPAPVQQPEYAASQSRPRSTSPVTSPPSQDHHVLMRNVTKQAPSGIPGDVRANVRGATGEIDTSKPGGVKTLKSKYEKSAAPPLSPTLFKRDSWQPQSNGEAHDSKVQFSKNVQHIPEPASPPIASQTVQPSYVPLVAAAAPPPPPPPPPINAASNKRSSDSSRSSSDEGVVEGTPVKVGTIQWPPPTQKTEKEKREPSKLHIQQNYIDLSPHDKPKNRHAAHAHMMEMIRLRNPEAEPEPVKKEEPKPTVNMAERRSVLAQQLSSVGVLKGPEENSVPPSPPLPPPPPPPALPPPRVRARESEPPPPPTPARHSYDVEDSAPVDLSDLRDLEKVKTQLFSGQHGPYLTYSGVPWKLEVRKEVFTPTEMLEAPALVHLVFCQIALDVFSNACVRIPKEEKTRMRGMLENNGVTAHNIHSNHKATLKRLVIDTARDWPYYFARLFPVNGGQRHPAVQVIGVGHSGVKLLAREKDLFEDNLHVVDQFRFEDIVDVSEPKPSVLQIHVDNDYVIVYTPRAGQIKHMIDAYCIESEKNVMYVRAVKDYLTRDPTLLHFHHGDIIKLTNRNMALDKGWLYGSLYGRIGLFPEEYIKPLARHELDKYDTSAKDDIYSDASIYSAIPDVQKFSMLEFAMLHFRESPFRYEMIRSEETGSIHGTFKMISSLKAKTMQRQQSKKRGEKDWTWKEQADMIKWAKSPIQASLLKFESPQMNKLSLECFISIMRYMGDYPLARSQKPIDCVYTILRSCHNHPELRDELYCQLAKQTTNNRSTKQESLQLGWRLMSIITAYFDCTDILKPYLFKYLETTALDLQRPHQALAAQCLQNLRQTFRYGGRKNVPSRVELEALTRGRNTKRQVCVMPGGVPVVLNIRSCSVVLDAIDQICSKLEIQDPLERDEFTIFYVIESGNRYLTLNREEYIFDITTELANQKKEFYLLFQRTSWVFPLHLDNNSLYIDVMYHQCIPDYLDGFLLPMPTSSLPENVKVEIAKLAALQIRANELQGVPKQRDMLACVPRTAHNVAGTGWTTLVGHELTDLQHRAPTPTKAKVMFLEKLSRWPLFGSTFFNVKSVSDPRVKAETLLAINRAGLHFLHSSSHETLLAYPFTQVVSTRRFKSKDGKNYLEMKVGDLMSQKITRIETDQGVDISALIGQYIHILKRYRN